MHIKVKLGVLINKTKSVDWFMYVENSTHSSKRKLQPRSKAYKALK